MPVLSANRRNVYNNPVHRDYSWRALFEINNETHECALNALKLVLDDECFDSVHIADSLKTIIKKRKKQDMSLWRRLLTSEYGDRILFHSRQGFIAFDEGKADNVLIYGSSKRSGYHTALNLLYLELLLRKHRPNASIAVAWNMGTGGDYSITINNETISYWNGKWYNDHVRISNLSKLIKYIKDMLH